MNHFAPEIFAEQREVFFMIKIIPAGKRHFSDFGWLKTYWLFSFSDYYDPGNMQFGALRVFNDDVVEPHSGFPAHAHQNMEIITLILDGEITHEDSVGNRAVIASNEVQRMSAGAGITHSEINLSEKAVHFYQIWIYPAKQGLDPGYEQKKFSPSLWKNCLCPLASGHGIPTAVHLNADAAVYRATLDQAKTVRFQSNPSRRIFIYMKEGALDINGTKVLAHGQARISEEPSLVIKAVRNSDFVLIDIADAGNGGMIG
jgi:redox-sensitive bicupin YhaK (pirin superfamily)